MSRAEELLNSVSNEVVTKNASEPHIIINAKTRRITVPEELKRIAVQYDHNIETVTFDCPRYFDGHDMSKMAVYINYRRPDGVMGSYLAENVVVDQYDETIMHFDWTISKNVTMADGNIMVLVCVKKTNDDGEEVNHWNSEINNDLYVSEGLECVEILEIYPDVITQLLLRIESVEADVTSTTVLTSPNGTKFHLSVADDGTLSTVAVVD